MSEPISATFVRTFGVPPAVQDSAPGRVNLLGEHTDYNDGFVLPLAIPQRTRVALRARGDREVRAFSAAFQQSRGYTLGAEAPTREWSDYVKGVTRSLAHAGFSIGGFEAALVSDVPVGAGLSSSAALEVALLRGLRRLFDLTLSDVDLAQLAQWGENHVVGAPVGILDPMASHLADVDAALFLDTRTLAFERLPLPLTVELVVVDSSVRHDHATGDYKTRRRECHDAARLLEVPALRDVAPDDRRIDELPYPLNRRARHVVTENARVLAAAGALRVGDAVALGALFNASHISQRDDFQVSHPAVDALVERAWADADVLGARLTGGGFGGSMVALVRQGEARRVGQHLSGGGARLLVPAPEPS